MADGAPQTIGTPSGPRIRRATSSTVSDRQRRIAFREIAEDDSRDASEISGLLQVHQRAIHLIGLHAAIFEHKIAPARVEFPRSAERRLHEREAAAEQNAFRRFRAPEALRRDRGASPASFPS